MDASALLILFDAAYLLALTAWMGGVLVLTFVVSPTVTRALGPEAAGRFDRALLPRSYAWGATAGALALPAYLCGPLSFPEYRGPGVAVQAALILAGTLIMLYGGNALSPAIDAARDAGPAGLERFGRLRRRRLGLDALVLAIGLALLVAFAARPAPRTVGIVEPTPAERTRRDLERWRKEHGPAARRSRPVAGSPISLDWRRPAGVD